jgi:hypothetical protein
MYIHIIKMDGDEEGRKKEASSFRCQTFFHPALNLSSSEMRESFRELPRI